MKRKTLYFVALLISLGLFGAGSLSAQMSGTTSALSAGGEVAGGGASSSSSYVVTGDVPITCTGISVGSSYILNGGIMAAAFGDVGLTAEYAGNTEQTISVADRTLKVGYSGGTGDASGTFYYRQGGASAYQAAAMTAGTGDTLEYDLSASMLGLRGLEYYFRVIRGTSTTDIGSSDDPYGFAVTLTNAQGHRPAAMPEARYRIIGVPVRPSSGSVSAVFGDDLGEYDPTQWRLGSYRSSDNTVTEYPSAPTVRPGRGYWLIARGGATYGTAGTSVRPNDEYNGSDYYRVTLDSGWNQMANPLPFDIALADILFEVNGTVVAGHPDTVLDNVAYWYNGTDYDAVTTIPDWDGAFIFIKRSDVTALVRYRATGAGAISSLKQLAQNPAEDNWNIHLQLEANGLIDDGNLIGVRPDAKDGPDRYDLSEPPPAPDGAWLAFRLPENADRLRRVDYRKPFVEGASWDMEISPAVDRRLECAGADKMPGGMEVWLAFDDGTTVQIHEGSRIAVPDRAQSARLYVGSKTFLDNEDDLSIPKTFALYQNYPNPFNPRTHIRYAVPEPGHVTLAVYNVLGQVVATLVDREMEPGDYTVIWDGRDEHGRPAASGIYFYRIHAKEFIKTNKMLLLK